MTTTANRLFWSALLVVAALGTWTPAAASECDSPRPEWILCEDFEAGGLGWDAWFAQSPFVECNGCPGGTNDPARIRLTDELGAAHDGIWALHMPAEASADFRGASLTHRTCTGDKRPGCDPLTGHERLFFRAWVQLAPDHQYVHHFMALGGTRPHNYWESDGNAGCRPNGYRHAGTTLEFNRSHELFFYTYFPEMHCDSGGYCSGDYAQQICDGCATKDMPCLSGLECCWGTSFSADPRPVLPRGQWVCLEIMMALNTPQQADGEMAFWVDGVLGHHQTGMRWRDVAELQLNKVWVQHYIDSGDASQSNRIWWDDIVASTARIGCGETLDAGAGRDAASAPDVASPPDSAGPHDATRPADSAIAPDSASPPDATRPTDATIPDAAGRPDNRSAPDAASRVDSTSPADATTTFDAVPGQDRSPRSRVSVAAGCACTQRAAGAPAPERLLGVAVILALRRLRRRPRGARP